MSLKLKGISAAPGIAIAPIVHFHTDLDLIPTREIGELTLGRNDLIAEMGVDACERTAG